MNTKMIIDKFNQNGKVQFKLFSLEYVIIKENDKVAIYPIIYDKQKKYYLSIDDALNNYTIYNETIVENDDRISNII